WAQRTLPTGRPAGYLSGRGSPVLPVRFSMYEIPSPTRPGSIAISPIDISSNVSGELKCSERDWQAGSRSPSTVPFLVAVTTSGVSVAALLRRMSVLYLLVRRAQKLEVHGIAIALPAPAPEEATALEREDDVLRHPARPALLPIRRPGLWVIVVELD